MGPRKNYILCVFRELDISKIWIFGKHTVDAAIANPARNVLEKVSLYDEPGFKKQGREWFDKKFGTSANHQGFAALIDEAHTLSVEEAAIENRVLVLDQITDPHNFGAIIRSAAVLGFRHIIIMTKNAATLTPTVYKTASGGMEHVGIIQATNLSKALTSLKKLGFWIIGLDERGRTILHEYKPSPSEKIALVVGAEGTGIRRLIKENCDILLRIDANPAFSTLNASNACAIAMYQLRG